jgi:hypothetical protein
VIPAILPLALGLHGYRRVAGVGRHGWPATSIVEDSADLDSSTEGIYPGA